MSFENDPYSSPLLDEEYMNTLITACAMERAEGKYSREVAEGDRLAAEFRKLFPDVSDKDLGTLLVVLTRVLLLLSGSTIANAAHNFDVTMTSYSHAAAVILKSVIDMREL